MTWGKQSMDKGGGRWEENKKNQIDLSLLPGMDNVSFLHKDAPYVGVNIGVPDYLKFC